MFRYLIATGLAIFMFAQLYSQERGYSKYRYPSVVPDLYSVDVHNEYDELRSIKVRARRKKKISFAENYAFAKKSMFESGMIYMDWKEAEDYLNEILQTIIPAEHQSKCEGLRVYLTTETHYNAYVMVQPEIYVTTGLLAGAENEAALAAIIGHELSHFLKDDTQTDYFRKIRRKDIKKQKNKHQDLGGIDFYKAAAEGHKNQQQEKSADSLGIIMAHNAGYDVSYAASNFLQMIDIQKRQIESSEYLQSMKDSEKEKLLKKSKVLADHPETALRIKYLENYLENNVSEKEELKEYIVGSENFKELQKLIRIEQLSQMLMTNDFRGCIETSFKQYLFYPNDEVNFYYLHESLRRFLYLDDENADKPFLTENLEKYFGIKFGILQDISFLVRDSANIEKIATKELIDKKPFNTYEEAMVYFTDFGEKNDYKESYLTAALYNFENESRDMYLAKYLAKDSVLYRSYAKAMLTEQLNNQILTEGRDVVVIPDVGFYKETRFGMIPNKFKSIERGPTYVEAMNSLCEKEFKTKEVVDLSTIKQENFDEYVYLNSVLSMTDGLGNEISKNNLQESLCSGFEGKVSTEQIKFKEILSKLDSNKKDIFILSPNMWYTFTNYKIRSIERFRVYDLNFKDRTLNGLWIYAYMYPVLRGVSGLFGRTFDYYAVDYTSFHIENQINYYDQIIINANLNKVFLQNTMYQMIETNRDMMELRTKDLEEAK